MIRFHSKAGADLLMLDAHAAAVLQALGRSPAGEGIFLPEQMAEALQHFQARQAAAEPEPLAADADEETGEPLPGLAQRAWPLLDLLRRAQQLGHPVSWSSA
jgi:hypothetical protein